MTHLKRALLCVLRGLTLGLVALVPVDAAEEKRRTGPESGDRVVLAVRSEAPGAAEPAKSPLASDAEGDWTASAVDPDEGDSPQAHALRRHLASLRLRGYRYGH